MWKVGLMLGVLAIAAGAGFFTALIYCMVVCGKNLIKRAERWDDEMALDKQNCTHERYRYTESHPEKVWTCNDCGEIF